MEEDREEEPVAAFEAHEPALNRRGVAFLYDRKGEQCGVWFPETQLGIIGATHICALFSNKQ